MIIGMRFADTKEKKDGDTHVVGLLVEEESYDDDYDDVSKLYFLQKGTHKTVLTRSILLDSI